MATMRTMGLIAAALALSGGLPRPADAQQMYTPTPYDSPPPRYPEPPPVRPDPPYELAPGGPIQFYSRPAGPAQPPAPPAPPPRPYVAPTPAPAEEYPAYSPYAEETGPGWLPPGDLIQVQDDRGIRYASGGVGEGERAELNALSGQFNLRLLFAMQGSGDYLADIKVTIVDQRGETVLRAESNGPWFYAQLPPGAYTVEASTPDQTQRQPVTIGARQSRLNFYWR
ncbi:MAG: carboxypeptidase regulatory-like domain-containing protein [Candidatus Competibacteraceae bacterium]|nr:MAG: carboxypeptidase regulatory-like domain-containing protein [Candidatus Competibacteraceae bacterium]